MLLQMDFIRDLILTRARELFIAWSVSVTPRMEEQAIGSCCDRKGQLEIKKEAIGTEHIYLWEKLTMDDEPG